MDEWLNRWIDGWLAIGGDDRQQPSPALCPYKLPARHMGFLADGYVTLLRPISYVTLLQPICDTRAF